MRIRGWWIMSEVPLSSCVTAPGSASIQEVVPVILHCASMSVAGFVPPANDTLDAIEREAERTGTPWIGEHLAFITADGLKVDEEYCGPADCSDLYGMSATR